MIRFLNHNLIHIDHSYSGLKIVSGRYRLSQSDAAVICVTAAVTAHTGRLFRKYSHFRHRRMTFEVFPDNRYSDIAHT
ncbi:hypothetical protein J6590_067278 [Homalodisca vitripennis]|nr:hypothetical protein J6590_067278 [Homalodisca vitripennis]